MFVQPMPPSIDGYFICKVYRELQGLDFPKSFIENANTFSYLISKSMTWSLSFLVS